MVKKDSSPLVSIIVPIYNVEQYLAQCLESIVIQSYRNIEIILINDGSTDASGTICTEYLHKDARIRYVYQNNQGPSVARNTGIEIASGELITFIDPDDYIHPRMIERLVKIKKVYKAQVAICQYRKVFGESLAEIDDTYKIHLYTGRDYVCHFFDPMVAGAYAWGKLYDISLFQTIRFPAHKLYEDIFTIPYVLYDVATVVKTNEVLYAYRQRDGSILHTFTKNRIDELESLIKVVQWGKQRRDRKLCFLAQCNVIRSYCELRHRYKKAGFSLVPLKQSYRNYVGRIILETVCPWLI